eukprot:GGOE01003076.1.p1 GENE.GGOE01003076.1~~GGOE01003076.1.p1  ORF type:complete len:399 (+),score=113.39 GGOE01003076.1:1853-3049(+)
MWFPFFLRWLRWSRRLPFALAMFPSTGYVQYMPRSERVAQKSNVAPIHIPSFGPKSELDVNAGRSQAYWDYEALQIQWNSCEKYCKMEKIGRGKYSDVYNGLIRTTGNPCVLKLLKPIKMSKMQREVKVLQNLHGGPNIIGLMDQVLSPKGDKVLVFEHVNNVDFRALYPSLTADDIRFYMFELLKALEFCHSMGIMHRDVKPLNVMFDYQNKKLRLIDWGLAEFYHADKEYNVSVASRYFKAPELLVGLRRYHYGLDMWSLGCVFADMIFRVHPFFKGLDNDDQLVKIASVLGTAELDAYLSKYSRCLKQPFRRFEESYPKRPFESFITAENSHLCSPDALDLLQRLLRYDHEERLSAMEAMAHPYFHPLHHSPSPTVAPLQAKASDPCISAIGSQI